MGGGLTPWLEFIMQRFTHLAFAAPQSGADR